MAYILRTVYTGCVCEKKKMHTVKANRKGAPRAVRANPTTENQKKINERRAEENLRWRLNANFSRRDLHLVLHYADKNRSFSQCLEDLKLFLRKLRKRCKAKSMPLTYICVTETKRMTNIHHHIILKKIPMDLIQDCWDEIVGNGGVSVRPLDNRGNHAKLANYLIKESRSTLKRYQELGKRGKRYTCSQGMIIPEPVYERIEADHWQENPKPRKGSYLFKWDNGETVRNGVDERGYPWQEYFEIYAEGVDLNKRKQRR